MKLFLSLIYKVVAIPQLNDIIDAFPNSLYVAKKMTELNSSPFVKYVSCSSCSSIYDPKDCSEITRTGIKQSKQCDYVRFPNHTQGRFRQKCGEYLMKTFSSMDGNKIFLYPKKIYCYMPLKHSIQNIVNRKDILEKLLAGPKLCSSEIMFDTVDGNFWEDFADDTGERYFADPRNLGGILNIDWFEPFENVQYSCGVIYLALLNLPRELRFKWENIIIVGIIPGPKEPKLVVNSYLQPLVNDLLTFWNPGELLIENGREVVYKFALCCISSDLPATRKCCGFVSYNALHGKNLRIWLIK